MTRIAEIRSRWVQGPIHGPDCDTCADKVAHAYQDMKYVLSLIPDEDEWWPSDLGVTEFNRGGLFGDRL